MRKYLLPEKGRFYKANLHCHSTLSDGRLTPAEIKAAYKEKGYSVVAFTDHWVMHDQSALCDDTFVALNGYEINLTDKAFISDDVPSKKTYHLNFIAKNPRVTAQVGFNPDAVWGKAKDYIPFVCYVGGIFDYSEYSAEAVNRMISDGNKNGFIVNYNPPAWSLQTPSEYMSQDGLFGVEVVNGVSTVDGYNDENSVIYAQMLRRDKSLVPIAADDNHNAFGIEGDRADSFIGFNMIKAERLDYESVTEALLRGDTYASSGPEIHELYIENGVLHIKTSPVRRIVVDSLGRSNICIQRRDGSTVTECEIPLDEKIKCFRVEITDKNGDRAYTRLYDNLS